MLGRMDNEVGEKRIGILSKLLLEQPLNYLRDRI